MRIGWCVSGRGLAAQAIVAAHHAGLLESGICVFVSDRPSPIAQFCEANAIPYFLKTAANLTQDLQTLRSEFALDWLGLTFNRLLEKAVIDDFGGRILNLHFSMLPLFPGLSPTKRAIASGMRVAGVTVHQIDEGVDTGTILGQAVCAIGPHDTVETLGKRQFSIAVPLLMQIVRMLERGQIALSGAKIEWPERESASGGNAFPHIDEDIASFAERFCATL